MSMVFAVIDPSALVSEFAAQLLSHVGRRVRIYLKDGRTIAGRIAEDPQTFYALGAAGDLVTHGMFVLRDAVEGTSKTPSFIGKIEDIVTYDVLPRRSHALI